MEKKYKFVKLNKEIRFYFMFLPVKYKSQLTFNTFDTFVWVIKHYIKILPEFVEKIL